MINTNLTQEDYDGFLLVGVSPSKQLIYVANQKDGNNKFLYWKLRKKFLKVMNLKMKDRIRKAILDHQLRAKSKKPVVD